MIRVKVAYISNKPPLVGEHAFPLMELNATFGDSGGIMSTARLELPSPCIRPKKKTKIRNRYNQVPYLTYGMGK